MAARVLRTALWYRITATLSSILIAVAGAYYARWGDTLPLQGAGVAGILFAAAAVADVFISRIVIDDDALHVISLVHKESYARAEFESAKLDGGQVALKKRDGGWVVLPGSGANALAVRNTLHAWIHRPTRIPQ